MESLYDGVCLSGPCSTLSDNLSGYGLSREWGPSTGSNLTYWICVVGTVTSIYVAIEASTIRSTVKPLIAVTTTCDVESTLATTHNASTHNDSETSLGLLGLLGMLSLILIITVSRLSSGYYITRR